MHWFSPVSCSARLWPTLQFMGADMKIVYLTIKMEINEDQSINDLIQEMDYSLEHDSILDHEITDYVVKLNDD
jgi:hypothetical protein